MKQKIYDEIINKFSSSEFVGAEIEIPIVNNVGDYKIDEKNIQRVFEMLLDYNFIVCSNDNNGNIIAIRNKNNGDVISLEYSLNTIEFSLSKEKTIFSLKNKFENYYRIISDYIKQFNYEFCCVGINPNYRKIDHRCLNHDRYKVIERLLQNNNNYLFGAFCSYCCSVQTHINVSREELIDLLNVLSKVDECKLKLFSNSYMPEIGLFNSRKYLWEHSNFGPNNVGNNKIFSSIDELVLDYLDRYIFYVKRKNKYLLLNRRYTLGKYLSMKKITATDDNGKKHYIKPEISDFQYFRSYRNVELTRYGTLEIRGDCTPKFEDIFKLVAFNVGLCSNYKKINEYINKYKTIDVDNLMKFSLEGLKNRNNNEEVFLKE